MTETKESLTAERDQLRRENEALQRQLDALASTAPDSRPIPGPPSFGLSQGERSDLETRGVTTSPWTGEQLLADDHGIEPVSDDARRALTRARSRRDPARRDPLDAAAAGT